MSAAQNLIEVGHLGDLQLLGLNEHLQIWATNKAFWKALWATKPQGRPMYILSPLNTKYLSTKLGFVLECKN